MLLLYCLSTPLLVGMPSRLSSRVPYHQRIGPSPCTSRSRSVGDRAATCRGDLSNIARVRPLPSSVNITAIFGVHGRDASGPPAPSAQPLICPPHYPAIFPPTPIAPGQPGPHPCAT